MANLSRSKKFTTREERRTSLENAFAACDMGVPVTVRDLATYLDLTERCVRDRLKEMDDLFWVHHGIVARKQENGKAE